jgi:hypothetical protein
MSEPTRPSIRALLADHALITAAITRGVRRAVLEHARAGRLIAVWEDGKVVWIPPQEMLARLSADAEAEGKGSQEPPAPKNGPAPS